ncbi:DUF411 domain-containing protein [Rhizobium lentis]|uniref:DUF411 domain-containing protein n=1 Tax=Rhizobium lentis TaxID=1138194 RepID=UPI001A924021|nr:DUF411 domain-containing protein [Rhizobium lentis]MBX5040123.1 DUF411 domain-containing protein [Rhizobium lentis]MBX5054783.1 DUF411 domain-containing protein [Rhizobium lentis]MBX5063596.1 DUF411 domain-containing protein [Rhizobium lentis]MBX5073009.1 DUF411 domain-containing protein [Rhizobium lentis]MBX5075702.1 DUF411 domain-containing protein [Rhizobium lentis]
MYRRNFIAMAASALAFPGGSVLAAAPAKMTVYKDPNCGCCHQWSKAMAAAGFSVDARDTDDLAAVKARLGVPAELEGCHTAVVDEYYLEGHVPLEAVQRLLGERPPLRGLAVPGMPPGSLGMGDDPQASYDVYAIPIGTGAPYLFMEVRPRKG